MRFPDETGEGHKRRDAEGGGGGRVMTREGRIAMTRVIKFPFRAAWFVVKWTTIGLIAFMVGLNFGR